jgi:solute carrier family 25 2-oxodicarboxylate transporter 21
MVEAPKRATKFAANEQYTILYKNILGNDINKQTLSILTGVSAGITEVTLLIGCFSLGHSTFQRAT